jgi:hypothetical protein
LPSQLLILKRRRENGVVSCRPLPIELPTGKEWRLDASQIDSLKAAVSPVFYSVADSGEVLRGLAALNLEAGKPILLVGNHQTIPVDIAPLVEGVRCRNPVSLFLSLERACARMHARATRARWGVSPLCELLSPATLLLSAAFFPPACM